MQQNPSGSGSTSAKPKWLQPPCLVPIDRQIVDAIVEATGWRPHSVRGAISGALKKKLGSTVEGAVVEDRGRVYRIVGHAFAVMAIGTSPAPAAISPGYLCICAPSVARDPGDGGAWLKLYRREDAEWLHLRGYLAVDESGHQAPYGEQLRLDRVVRLAVVVYVKRKP